MKKITVIGGGTGTFVVLSGLKKEVIDLGVIVNMMDSGGSTGKLRDQLGVLPPGDLRQCLVALSDAPALWRKLFLYRFDSGDLSGHNFGNLFLSVLEKTTNDYNEVIDHASFVLKTKGIVVPVTFDKTHLCVEYNDGAILKGEGNIDINFRESSGIRQAFLEPKISPNPKAVSRILDSDYIIIGPGDLYTSIIPVLLVDGVVNAIKKSKAKIIYIMNLMTKSGQTTHYTASMHINDLQKYLKLSPNYVMLNNGAIPKDVEMWYKKNNEIQVRDDLNKNNYKGIILRKNLVAAILIEKENGDKIPRSILRHSSIKIANCIKQIIR